MVEERKDGLLDFLLLRHLRDAMTERIFGTKPSSNLAPIGLFAEVLQAANQRAEGWGASMVFVYLPGAGRFGEDKALPPAYRMRDQVLQVVRELGIPEIDVLQAWESTPQPLSFYALNGLGHYNAEGYRAAGETILHFLRQHEGLALWGER